MKEIVPTTVLLSIAAILSVVAFLTRHVVTEIELQDQVGQILFPEFTSPDDIETIEIVRFGEQKKPQTLRVALVDGVWSIPSHEDYPADGHSQLGRIAEALLDLPVLDVIDPAAEGSDPFSLQVQSGVIDPTTPGAEISDGAGIRVTFLGKNHRTLADLIIGNAVSANRVGDFSSDNPEGLHHVRLADQSPIYVVKIDPKRFVTDFDQWIEGNLLDISTQDIREIVVDEYSVTSTTILHNRNGLNVPIEQVSPLFIGDFTLSYQPAAVGSDKWRLNKLMQFRGSQFEIYEEKKPEENQELDAHALDTLIQTLGDLKPVDVKKKTESLAAVFRDSKPFAEILGDEQLAQCGFHIVALPDLKRENNNDENTEEAEKLSLKLLSRFGDLEIRMKDGIVYTLHFGCQKFPVAASIAAGPPSESRVPFFLLLTVGFDESAVAMPDIQPDFTVADDATEATREAAKREQEKIDRSNERERTRYTKEMEAGHERAKKLNAKFADWFYLIPNDAFDKIHLTRLTAFRTKPLVAKDDEKE